MEIHVHYPNKKYIITSDLGSDLIKNILSYTEPILSDNLSDKKYIIELKEYENLFKVLLMPDLIFNHLSKIEVESKTFDDIINGIEKLYINLSYFLLRKPNDIDAYLTIYIRNLYYKKYRPIYNEKYKDYVRTNSFKKNTIEYIENNDIDWYFLCLKNYIPLQFLRKNIENVETTILKNISIPFSFIELYISNLKQKLIPGISNDHIIHMISQRPDISFSFIENNMHNFIYGTWSDICMNIFLTDEFIIKFNNNIIWNSISKNKTLTTELIEKYKDYLNWDKLAYNLFVDINIISKYQDRIKNIVYTFLNPSINIEYVEKNMNFLSTNIEARKLLSQNPHISHDIIDRCVYLFDWKLLSANKALSLEYLYKYIDRVQPSVYENKNIDEEFIKIYSKNHNKVIYLYPSIIPGIIEKYVSYFKRSYRTTIDMIVEDKINNTKHSRIINEIIGNELTEFQSMIIFCLNLLRKLILNDNTTSMMAMLRCLEFTRFIILRNNAIIFKNNEQDKLDFIEQIKQLLCYSLTNDDLIYSERYAFQTKSICSKTLSILKLKL